MQEVLLCYLIVNVQFVDQETSFSSCDDGSHQLVSSNSPLLLLPADDDTDYSCDHGSVTTYITATTLLDTPDRKPVDNKMQKANELRLPLDKTEYLQPQSSAPATYLDLEITNTNGSETGNQMGNYAAYRV
jgi:hypothetical protein